MDNALDYEARVRELLEKQEIYEALLRYCRGVDRVDAELIRSVFHTDATENHGLVPGMDAGQLFVDHMQHCDRSLHFIENVLIEIDGDVAHCETYYHAVNYNDYTLNSKIVGWGNDEGEGTTVSHAYGRYIDRFERRDGAWRIAHRMYVNESLQTERVMMPSPPAKVSKRSHEDPSYTMRLATPAGEAGSN